jgi:parvulin-like peptidyl-prolyl isomerase
MLMLLLCGCGQPDPSSPRFVVAEGKGFKIRRADLNAATEDAFRQLAAMKRNDASEEQQKIKRATLEKLIEEELLQLEAKRLGLEDKARKIAADKWQAFEKRYATPEEKKTFVTRTGKSMEDIKKRFYETAMKNAVLEASKKKSPKAARPLKMPPQKLLDNSKERWALTEAFVPLSAEGASAEELEGLAEVIVSVWEAESMEKETAQFSPAVRKQLRFRNVRNPDKDLPAAAQTAAKNLKQGQIVGPIRCEDGWRVLGFRRVPSLKERLDKRNELFAKRFEEQQGEWRKWMDGLKKEYGVEISNFRFLSD